MEEKKYLRYFLLLLLLTTLVRIWLAWTLGLGVDESHYVEYTVNPALSYYDHPPLIGYLIKIFITLMGRSPIAVRVPAILSGIGTAMLLFVLGRKLHSAAAGYWTAVIFNCIPIFSAVGISAVPETIFCFFYLLAFLILWRLHETGRAYLWYYAGMVMGLAMMTKYTAFFLYPAVFLFAASVPSMRIWFRKKEFYIALLVSLLMFLPVIIWNYENYWASFTFQMARGLGEKAFFRPQMFLRNFGAQAGVLSPLIFFFLIYALIYTIFTSIRGNEISVLFLSFSLPIILTFGYSGLANKVLPYWPAAGYLVLLPVLGKLVSGFMGDMRRKALRYLFVFSLALSCLLTIAVLSQAVFKIFPVPAKDDVTNDLLGWKELAGRIKEIRNAEKDADFFVFTNTFFIASQLAFYLKPEIQVYSLSRRVDPYDFWQYPENLPVKLAGRNGIFFCDDHFKTSPGKLYVFKNIGEKEMVPVYYRGKYAKSFHIYRCYGLDTQKTPAVMLQSLPFQPRSFRKDSMRWNERGFFLINGLAKKNRIADGILVFFSWLGSSYILVPAVVLLTWFRKRKEFWRYLAVFLLTLLAGGIAVHFLKEIFPFPRPLKYFGEGTSVNIIGPALRNNSFPSGHSQTVFTGVLFLAWLMPGWRVPLWVTGILSGMARCYMGAHFPLDGIAGFAIALIFFIPIRAAFEKKEIRLPRIDFRNRKRVFRLLAAIAGILVLFLLPRIPRSLINVETGIVATDVELVVPASARIFAPFLDFPFYFSNLASPKTQILSWLIWFSAGWLLFGLLRLRGSFPGKTARLLRGIVVTVLSFLLLVAWCIFFPLPQYRLKSKNPDEVFLDLHSHTIYSHDGIASPGKSVSWHLDSGFGGWAITEHDSIGDAVPEQEEIIRRDSVDAVAITGEEVSFKGVHLNLLGITEDVDKSMYGDLSGLVRAVHLRNGAVIVPHYWAEKKSTFSTGDLSEAGVDGFEIEGNSSVPLTPEWRQEIIGLCRKEGLLMVSGSNWHGWQPFCNAWTGFKVVGWAGMDNPSRKKVIIDALRRRETGRFTVIGYRQRHYPGGYFFEPFTGFISYFCSLDKWQRLSWLFWAAAICFFARSIRDKRKPVIILWTVISLALIAKAVFILHTWQSVRHVNNILPQVSNGLFLMAIMTISLAVSNIRKRRAHRLS